MIPYPELDPIALSLGPFTLGDKVIGPLNVHWYGIMYLLSFVLAWYVGWHRAGQKHSVIQRKQVEDLIVYGAFGVIIGGRLGYAFLYHFDKLQQDPTWLFRVWEGGMSFHGGLIGVIVAMLIYARKIGVSFLAVADFVAPLEPIGQFFGRIGNFIGQELWGRSTDGPWAMVFPNDPLALPRHPSQLYQACLEGLLLFVILFWFSRKPRPKGATSGLFLVGYGVFRFVVEFAREPDSHLRDHLLLGWMTRGQVLCVPMIVAGILLIAWAYWRHQKLSAATLQPEGNQ